MPGSRDPQRRLIAIRTFMEIRRAISKAAKEADLSYEEVIAAMAVRLGQLEGKPMDISSVAETAALPFASSHRYLQRLRKREFILAEAKGKRVVLRPNHGGEEDPTISQAYSEIDRALRKATRELNKLNHLNG
jgi:DNA-binding IclR family transcriptional regulator